MLNPKMASDGMERQKYLNSKFGSQKKAEKIYNEIKNTALTNNIKINFSKIKRTPNTLDAHRLIHWAGPRQQKKAVNLLFEDYFINGNDISEKKILIDIAKKIGLNPDDFNQLLSSDEDKENIYQRIKNASDKGVNGVPCFIVNNTYVLQGAQPTELWLKVIEEVSGNTN
jgi:predicted DsbA family dithiol-disulfide isomerase